MKVVDRPKAAALMIAKNSGKSVMYRRTPNQKSGLAAPVATMAVPHPASIATAIANVTTIGVAASPATTRGTTRYATGSRPMTSSASTCSVTTIAPSSAAIRVPTMPTSAKPVNSGVISVTRLAATTLPTTHDGSVPSN
jgi:hypothetical protein